MGVCPEVEILSEQGAAEGEKDGKEKASTPSDIVRREFDHDEHSDRNNAVAMLKHIIEKVAMPGTWLDLMDNGSTVLQHKNKRKTRRQWVSEALSKWSMCCIVSKSNLNNRTETAT